MQGDQAESVSPYAYQAKIKERPLATLTHGVPGVAIGAIVAITLLANHLIHEMWLALPILTSLFVMLSGIFWVIVSVERCIKRMLKHTDNKWSKEEDSEMFTTPVILGSILFVGGTLSFGFTWANSRPYQAPPPPPPSLSCKSHGGINPVNGISRHNGEGHRFETDVVITTIVCSDGTTFSDPVQ